MSGRPLLPHLLAAAILGGACLPALAADDFTPRPQRTFAEKPRIEDYADYNAFLVDIMEFRRQKQERQQARTRNATPAAALADDTLGNVSGQRESDLRELYDISEPETLEDALARARKLPHPVYQEAERFGRSTANSFPMPPMEVEDLSARDVTGLLQDLEQTNPEIFRNPGDEQQAEHILEKDPGNTDDATEVKAAEDVASIFRPFFDIAGRNGSDSDGKVVKVPVIVPNEIGYTVIHNLNIRIGTLD